MVKKKIRTIDQIEREHIKELKREIREANKKGKPIFCKIKKGKDVTFEGAPG